ncbi:hypothetical protein JW897_12160 [Chromobacterium alkanivorans]|uniref:hypothetical protein n=1 Tax=Chromobacterium alkanivorans TaxID=1071719 RepID=UPI001967BD43|nr:hypothetical protein [Chromobacterium alkanivorans]MBN3004489.1 hypothetical protein [Chromobacterium alkanivorans]
MQRTAHFIMQGKGGCFKSGTSSLVAQYLTTMASALIQCFDTDPVNRTFSRITSLGVQGVELLNNHQQIATREFDTLIGRILDHSGHTVTDTGASVFVPLKSYLVQSDALGLLVDEGIRPIIHVPLLGGLDFVETANGLQDILEDLPAADIVAWCNPYHGPVEHEGRGIEQSQLYLQNRHRFAGIVHMMELDPHTFGQDYAEMRSDGLTYAEAVQHSAYSPVARRRLARVWAYYCNALDGLDIGQKAAVAA